MSGFVSVRLSGARRADWDLTVADAASGRRLAVSTEGVATWTEPGHGQNPNGINQHITLQNPPVGKYVAQIVNSSAVLNDWTLTVTRTGQREGHVESTGITESYTLTCLKGDKVLAERPVTVSRGQRLDLGRVCG